MPRILILTASMGEGHNTAARNIRDALVAESRGDAEVLVADPYTRTNPVINKLMQKGYATAINRYPRAWRVVFGLLSKRGVVEGMGPILAELTAAVKALIDEFRPDIIASTYPVFSFLMAKIRRKRHIGHRAVLHGHHRLHDDQFSLVPLPMRWVDRGG